MTHQQQIFAWLQQDDMRMHALLLLRELGLNDGWLGAGFVRNLVWDRLHEHPVSTPLNDIDVIYYDRHACSRQRDHHYEQQLLAQAPYPWSVKNQARMHMRHGHLPYLNAGEAISYWVEVETAVAVRLNATGELELLAPLGIDALFTYTITHNPRHSQPEAFLTRVESKGWQRRWPKLRLVPQASQV